MKRTIILIGLFISIVLSSCREISIITVVNKDGSFTRIVKITGDSSEVFRSNLPYPVDTTWEMEFMKDTTGDGENEYVLKYIKSFNNSDILNQEFEHDTSWRKELNRNIVVEKKFGFFYSYLVYEETIGAANPFQKQDYKKYISKEDMLWLTGKKLALNSSDSLKIKEADDAAEEFLQEALTNEIIAVLKNGIEQLNNPDINPDMVNSYKDSIELKVYEWQYKSALEFVDYLAEWTNNNDIYKLKEISSGLFEKLDDNIQLLVKVFEMEDYKVSVKLPGIITETNSLSTKGNRVQWNVNASSILLEDFVMIAESRVVNKWMFVIAGIVLLLLIVLTVYKSVRLKA